ncbi:hypothetical protein CALVIDRAFT_501720 [Calocera viscosa TUFC12733]|uniref:Large ribosomal subunit protein mL59 domain-containing protein n=1 Tax=Calocera viscosa (strain TUFC12733) TaxID=1330018 RepID=A0A167K1M7_CALVF|nr:hypothetical protein CALVIDRAFT_501720 [Calocera viscosa TUFC12733]
MASLFTRTPSSPLLAAFLSRVRTRALAALPPSQHSSPPTPLPVQNPFIPRYNPASRCWAPPEYSKRRQKELLRAAQEEGFEEWMPRGEGERVGGGKRAMRKAHAPVVIQPETAEEGAGVEVEVQGESTVVELAPVAPAVPVPLVAAAVSKLAQKHVPQPNTTPQEMADPTAPFQWIGVPSPVYNHPTVYGSKPREKWFKGHKWVRARAEKQKEIDHNIETMDERIQDWRNNRELRRKSGKVKGGLPF